jgi:hypothetical protein
MSDFREGPVVDVLDADAGDRVVSPRLRAVDTTAEARIAELEAQIADERSARVEAEASARQIAQAIAQVRKELAAEREAHACTDATAREMAVLVAHEHQRNSQLEKDLRLARGQIPLVAQDELRAAKKGLASKRVRRALGR